MTSGWFCLVDPLASIADPTIWLNRVPALGIAVKSVHWQFDSNGIFGTWNQGPEFLTPSVL